MTDLAYRTRRRSVKRDDLGPLAVTYLLPFYDATWLPLPATPGVWWSPAQDAVLRSTIQHEGMWASAIAIATTKLASLAWDVESTQPRVRARAQELLLNADGGPAAGGGWASFAEKQVAAYLLTNNGAFFEIERETRAYGSRIRAIHHLPSGRCRRTGDPERPVIYTDLRGAEHALPWHAVVSLVDQPDEEERHGGVGHCAAERAYTAILKLATIERYLYEKMSGQRGTGIDFISGVTRKQLTEAMSQASEAQQATGAIAYKARTLIPIPDATAQINIASVEFSSAPDWFEATEERNQAYLQMANSIGLDPQDIQPLTGQALGTGAQSQVLDDKASGKGLVSYRQKMTHALNQLVMNDVTTFVFTERDPRDKRAEADLQRTQAETVEGLVTSGLLRPDQALEVLVERDVLDASILPATAQPQQALSDTEKPDAAGDDALAVAVTDTTEATKEAGDIDTLFAQELEAARTLARKVLRDGANPADK